MELVTLKNLVRNGEGYHLEFKLKATHPLKIMREIVAFANSGGGILLIGVGDDKSIIGSKYPFEDEYVMINTIEKYCIPKIQYRIEKVKTQNDREVLAIRVASSMNKPHYIIETNQQEDKKVYVRVADKSIQASREMREILKGKKKLDGYRFQIGEKESKLFKYLELQEQITLEQFSKLANIPKKIASRTLILLVLSKVLEIIPSEQGDFFKIFNEANN